MNSIITAVVRLALLLTIIPNVVRGATLLEDLWMMENANNDINIDNIFKPSEGGLLGKGGYGITYKGVLLPLRKEVAMKFTKLEHKTTAEKEYKIYAYLNAINNPDVEAFGIPTIFYYGTWHDHVLMAMTLLESPLKRKIKQITEVDLLIVFQQIVRTTKYIHSHGVCHNDLKLDNVMFHHHQAFVIDYNLAIDIYASRKEKKSADPKGDWKCFLFALFPLVRSKPQWLGYSDNDMSRIKGPLAFMDRLLQDATISEQFSGLRRVFVEFAKHSNMNQGESSKGKGKGKELPSTVSFYDLVYEVITDELEKVGRRYTETPSISTIDGTWGTTKPNFTNDQYEFFSELYRDELIKAGRTFDRKPSGRWYEKTLRKLMAHFVKI